MTEKYASEIAILFTVLQTEVPILVVSSISSVRRGLLHVNDPFSSPSDVCVLPSPRQSNAGNVINTPARSL